MTVAKVPTIVLSNPDARPAAYQLARAVQERGALRKFFTGYYCKQGPLVSALRQGLPPSLWEPLWRELRRRHTDGLSPEAIHCGYFFEFMNKLHERCGSLEAVKRATLKVKTLLYDVQVARKLKWLPLDMFVFFNDVAATHSLPAAKSLGALTVLRSEIPHSLDWLALCREESRLAPNFAQGMADDTLETWLLKRRLQEFHNADFILANSPFVKQSLVKHGVKTDKIYVLPGGADVEKFAAPRPQSSTNGNTPFQVLFVGAICQRKGVGYLLEAFRNLNLPKSRLTLVGPLLDPHLLAHGAGLNGNIRHIPPVPHHEVPKYFAQADIFVFPSLLEGSAYVTYEAMAAGLPVVTTLSAGSYVRHGADGFVVPIRDPEALQDAIEFLYWNKDSRQWMGRNARERARLFTWDRYRQNAFSVLSHIHRHGALPPPLPDYGDT